jgi:TIR domain
VWRRVADIFVSYTSNDKDWANWIGLELEKLGNSARVDEWEISAGGDIPAWMEDRIQKQTAFSLSLAPSI